MIKVFTALEILGWYWPLGLLKMIMFTGIQYLPILTTEDSEKIAPFNILSNLILFSFSDGDEERVFSWCFTSSAHC